MGQWFGLEYTETDFGPSACRTNQLKRVSQRSHLLGIEPSGWGILCSPFLDYLTIPNPSGLARNGKAHRTAIKTQMQACAFRNALRQNPAQEAPNVARQPSSRSTRWNLLFPASSFILLCPKSRTLSPPPSPPTPPQDTQEKAWPLRTRRGKVKPCQPSSKLQATRRERIWLRTADHGSPLKETHPGQAALTNHSAFGNLA